MTSIVNILDILFWIIYMLNVPRMLHVMQLESYQNDGMFRWIIKNPKIAFKKGGIQFLITGIVYLLSGIIVVALKDVLKEEYALAAYFARIGVSFLACLVTNIILFIQDHKERKVAKKPLKYTSRAKRLIVYNFFMLVILQVLFRGVLADSYPDNIKQIGNVSFPYVENYSGDTEKYEEDLKTYYECRIVYNAYDDEQYLMIQAVLFSFLIFTLPVNMILSNFLAAPMENAINNHYINKADRKLRKKEYKDLIRIGITGSYGKTSTKFILKTILSEKYNVLATPGSYNTTMGNVRIIREQLMPEHQVFISEMGARKRYDIQEICQFVRPQLGIITSIGPQHLETFKKIENVAKTKGELLKGVTADGVVFLPKDNAHCLE